MTQQEVWKQKVDLFRKRFGSREDVFTVRQTFQKTVYDPDDIEKLNPRVEEVSTFSPQCMNYGNQKLCLITQNKGGCTTCDHKRYQPLTDEWIWKHISGEKELVLHLLQREGIKFGACDFDYGTHFEDAKAVRDESMKYGLPSYIARSSKKGYHLYWFFATPVPAHLFTSLIHHIYEKVGFTARYQENIEMKIPETFPKQVNYDPAKPGNGIKIPMIEPKIKEGFNCWVDDDAKPIPTDEQWSYFTNCKEITLEQLEKVIAEQKIEVLNVPVSRSRRAAANAGTDKENREPIPPRGDFWKVVERCPALKQFWEKDEAGRYKIGPDAKGDHNHRTASIAFAAATENGLEIVRDRWKSISIEAEIDYALESTQHPWTCKAMQESGLCRIGTHPVKRDHCMKKIPPGEMRNNQYVVNPDNLPESEWKDPSPVRFASGYMTLDQLTKALDALFSFREKKEPEPEDLAVRVKEIYASAGKLDPEDGGAFHSYVAVKKYMPEKEAKQLRKIVAKEIKEEAVKIDKKTHPHFSFHGKDYMQKDGGYVQISRALDGSPSTLPITNFTIEIKEEITLIKPKDLDDPKEEQTIEHRWVKGIIHVGTKHYTFKTASDEWLRSSEAFFTFIMNRAGTEVQYETQDFNAIRNCIGTFSKDLKVIRKKVEDFGHYMIKGEHAYISPSVIITKDYIRPNDEFELEFSDDTCKSLDFKIIDESQFKDLSLHIITDYFECNSSIATMALFAHAMAASIMSHIPLTKSPVLWIGGSFGNGKSFIAEMAQCFYGNFSSLTGMKSTGLAKLQIAHKFRDAFFVMDDFKKSLNEHNTKQMMEFIQNAYDRSGRQALQRHGELRDKTTRVRSLVATTGEDCPLEEASVVSRMIMVDAGKNCMNVEKGNKVRDRRIDYCGFTPYFIQFVYNMTEEEVRRIYNEYLAYFEQRNKEAGVKENSYRISENLAFNMTGFRLIMDLLVDKGVIPDKRKDEFCARHLKNLEICRETIISNAGSQRAAALFLDSIKELLQDPARYHIINWGEHDPSEHKSSKALGFYREKTPDVVYIYPGTAHGEVETHLNKSKSWSQSKHHIGRQLLEDGHIPPGMHDPKSTSNTKYVTTPQGNRHYCWAIKLESLGFTPSKISPKELTTTSLEVVPQNIVAKIAVNE
jgi:hypothetical protein